MLQNQLHADFPVLQKWRKGKQFVTHPLCQSAILCLSIVFGVTLTLCLLVFNQVDEFSGANVETLKEKLEKHRTQMKRSSVAFCCCAQKTSVSCQRTVTIRSSAPHRHSSHSCVGKRAFVLDGCLDSISNINTIITVKLQFYAPVSCLSSVDVIKVHRNFCVLEIYFLN